MLFANHVLIGVLFFFGLESFLGSEFVVGAFVFVMLGALFPDIDEEHSHVSKASGVFGKSLAVIFGHRGLLHSIFLFLVLSFLLGYFWSFRYGLAFFVGYSSHIFCDSFTRGGIRPFLPFSVAVIRGPIRVGSFTEKMITIICFVIVVLIVWLKL